MSDASESANDWQPAIVLRGPMNEGHSNKKSAIYEEMRSICGDAHIKIRVRLMDHIPLYYVCGTERAFEAHPDDLDKILGRHWDRKVTICEHRILSD